MINLNDYLGKPWVMGANGPDAFDCWGLLEYIYLQEKNVHLPRYTNIDKSNRKQVVEQVKNSIQSTWKLLEKPVNFCAVGISNLPDRIYHVGCFLDTDMGQVIHTQKNIGCMIEPLHKITLNWRYIKFYGLR